MTSPPARVHPCCVQQTLKELGALRVDTLVLAQSVTTHREQMAVERQVATSVAKVAEWIHLVEAMRGATQQSGPEGPSARLGRGRPGGPGHG